MMNTNTATYRFWALVLLFVWPLQVAAAGCSMPLEKVDHHEGSGHAAFTSDCCVLNHASAGESEHCAHGHSKQQPSEVQHASSCDHQVECACSLTHAEARRSLTTVVPTVSVKFVLVDSATLEMPENTRDFRWAGARNDDRPPRSEPLYVLNESFLN